MRFRAIAPFVPSLVLAYRDAPFARRRLMARAQARDVEDFCGLGRGLFEIVNVQNWTGNRITAFPSGMRSGCPSVCSFLPVSHSGKCSPLVRRRRVFDSRNRLHFALEALR